MSSRWPPCYGEARTGPSLADFNANPQGNLCGHCRPGGDTDVGTTAMVDSTCVRITSRKIGLDAPGVRSTSNGADCPWPYCFELPEEEQTAYSASFGMLVLSALAAEVGGYAGERFKRDGSKSLKRGPLLVCCRQLEPNGETVRLGCALELSRRGCQIVKRRAEGVRDLALKRAEYAAASKRSGLPGLFSQMCEQTHINAGQTAHSQPRHCRKLACTKAFSPSTIYRLRTASMTSGRCAHV